MITYSFDIPMAVMNLFILTNEEKPMQNDFLAQNLENLTKAE